jgi:hypothetical protein
MLVSLTTVLLDDDPPPPPPAAPEEDDDDDDVESVEVVEEAEVVAVLVEDEAAVDDPLPVVLVFSKSDEVREDETALTDMTIPLFYSRRTHVTPLKRARLFAGRRCETTGHGSANDVLLETRGYWRNPAHIS